MTMAEIFNKTKELYLAARFRILERAKDLLFSRKKVWCRSACLGKEVFALVYGEKNYKLVNMQKARVDLLFSWITGAAQRPKAAAVKPYIKRRDIYPFIKEQAKMPWPRAKEDFEFLLMDTFSELTDQKFAHKKEGWSFCSHRSDIDHSAGFGEIFESNGLLKQDDFGKAYENFFGWFEKNYPGKKVIIIHTPTAWAVFQARHAEILRVLQNMEKTRNYIYNIFLPESQVQWADEDKFYYHFTDKTKKELAEVWREAEKTKAKSKIVA
jgi:hypothetical protein